MAGRSFALDYHHEPGSPRDGVTLTVPLLALTGRCGSVRLLVRGAA